VTDETIGKMPDKAINPYQGDVVIRYILNQEYNSYRFSLIVYFYPISHWGSVQFLFIFQVAPVI
jgi:hypothetical protein